MFCWAWIKKLLYRRLLTLLLVSYFLMITVFLFSLESDPTDDSEPSFESFDQSLHNNPLDSLEKAANFQYVTHIDKNSKDRVQTHYGTDMMALNRNRTQVKFAEPVPLPTPNLFAKVENGNAERFVPIGVETYAYSAFLDNRKELTYIRILTLRSEQASTMLIYCHFSEHLDLEPVAMTLYELCENHALVFGGYIYSCQVPEVVDSKNLKSAIVSVNKYGSKIALSLLSVRPPEHKIAYLDLYPHNNSVTNASTLGNNNRVNNVSGKNANFENVSNRTKTKTPHSNTHLSFAICVSPLFGSTSAHRLVEFVEFSLLLGAEHFIFYIESVNPQVTKVLNYYSNKKIISLLQWNLPSDVKDIWNYGQLLANNDCLYRTMSHFDLVAFNDIDEFIVPHSNASTWREAFSSFLTENRSGFSFQSAFFDLGLKGLLQPIVLTPVLTSRTQIYSKVRTKVMLCPWRVFEVGIHHISKQNQEEWLSWHVPPDLAYIHHYRSCISDYDMKCNLWMNDNIVADRYGIDLGINYQTAITNIVL